MIDCSYPPTYDGIGADEYIEWEIALDKIFANHSMCARRKVQNATSVLRDSASTWWETLSSSDKPQSWNDMKILMRQTFVNPPPVLNSNDEVHHLDDQSIVIPLAMANLLQDTVQNRGHNMKENEVLTASCQNSEPSFHTAPLTPAENESKGNAHGATLMDGVTSLDVLNYSTNHAFIEQLLVEPTIDPSLSQNDFLDVPCHKDDLCDNAFAIHVLKPHTCAEITHVIHITSANDELKMLSSLNTLDYTEFDVFCNLNCLEDRLVQYADLPWFSRHTYHAIGKYNNKGQYMCYRHNLARLEGGPQARWDQRIIVMGLRIGPCVGVLRPGFAMYLDRCVHLN
jgi:hypothetical protein